MKKYNVYFCILATLLFSACRDHEPVVEELPREAVSFTYLIPGDYSLDYYVDSEIQFTNTSQAKGTAQWTFGDGATAEGDVVTHVYDEAGSYIVTLSIRQDDGTTQTKRQPCMITDIKPIMTINPFEGDVCEVLSTKVSFNVELPNPKNRQEEYLWIFPEGTTNIEGDTLKTSTNRLPGEVIFNNVGSQTVRLQARLDGRLLEEAAINVQVGYNKDVPTLYYAVKGGNIMALKLADDAPETMKIMPYDLSVSAGQHPFCLLFSDSLLYMLDCGKQFYFVDDADGVLGDGKISVIAKDGSKVETMISNVGQAAFDDPFYGYIEGKFLYYANRNTGIIAVPLTDRNKMYNATDYPYYVQHSTLEYYNKGWNYGAIGGVFGKVDGVWYWCQYSLSKGIYRFRDSDILKEPIAEGKNPPEAGIALSSIGVKSYVYNNKTKEFFFTVIDEGFNTIYRCPSIEALNAIGNKKTALAPFKLEHESGLAIEANISGKPAAYEGTSAEPVGICELALDETTGCVYFGYRSSGDPTTVPSGLMRYNPATGKVETVIEGVDIYGLAINPTPSKLF